MPIQNTSPTIPEISDILPDVLPALRLQLIALLPRAMACAIASYQEFSAQTAPEDAKQYIAHHNACRAALAHVDYLSKLAKWVTTSHPHHDDAQDLQPLIQKARDMLLHMNSPSLSADDTDEDHTF
jgi:hypothetical protein